MVTKIWTERAEKYKQVRSTVNKELKNHQRYVIDPRTCKWLGAWDLTSFACLGFTAIATPIEVQRPCICAPRATPLRPTRSSASIGGNRPRRRQVSFLSDAAVGWFVANWTVNIFFFCDLIMSFFLAYQCSDDQGSSSSKQQWVTEPRAIKMHCAPRTRARFCAFAPVSLATPSKDGFLDF